MDERDSLLFKKRKKKEEIPEPADELDSRDDQLKLLYARFYSLLVKEKSQLSPPQRLQFHPETILQVIEKNDLHCPYCTVKITARNVSCDRIDNSKGHKPNNVIFTCSACNIARSDHYSVEEFIAVCRCLNHVRKMPQEQFSLDFSDIQIPSSVKKNCQLNFH